MSARVGKSTLFFAAEDIAMQQGSPDSVSRSERLQAALNQNMRNNKSTRRKARKTELSLQKLLQRFEVTCLAWEAGGVDCKCPCAFSAIHPDHKQLSVWMVFFTRTLLARTASRSGSQRRMTLLL